MTNLKIAAIVVTVLVDDHETYGPSEEVFAIAEL
jgi:hypothetical protein